MGGTLVTLTVGGLLYEQVGFIGSLGYNVNKDSPWEIAINDEGGYGERTYCCRNSNRIGFQQCRLDFLDFGLDFA